MPIFTPRENNRLLDYYKIISISARAKMGVSGQYGCLFSRCRKYVINSLIHGHFHIGLVIIPRPILALNFCIYTWNTCLVMELNQISHAAVYQRRGASERCDFNQIVIQFSWRHFPLIAAIKRFILVSFSLSIFI